MAKLSFTWTSRGPDRYEQQHHQPGFLRCGVTSSLYFLTRQRLSINVPAVSVAENMMDLIDGYCRLENDTDGTVIYRPNKGTYGQGSLLYRNKLC